jgi:microcystin-dependent protein
LLADGSAVSRTTFAALFAVIGTTYGAGDSSTTFNLPDLRGRTPVGVGTHPSVALGSSDGVPEPDRQPLHTHSVPAHSHGLGSLAVAGGAANASFNYTVESMEPCHNSGLGCTLVVRGIGSGTIPVTAFGGFHSHGLTGRIGVATGADGDGALATAASAPSFVVVNYIIRAQ